MGFMQQQLDSILSQDDETIVLEWILLPHSRYWKKCDCKILVTSDDARRKNKVMERDNISEEYFDKRDSASIDYSQIKFDYIFENDYQAQTMRKILDRISEKSIFHRTLAAEEGKVINLSKIQAKEEGMR